MRMTRSGKATPPRHLLTGPPVNGHTVQRDEEQHAFVIDQHLISCTPTEYRVLGLLLAHVDQCVRYGPLLAQLQEEPLEETGLWKQARTRLMHVISDLRPKIWVLDWEIVAVMQTGYLLVCSHEEEPTQVEHH